ncbi:hypothetical protein [Solirubrobacter ginsenosidimutans]|uniref:hypothetical protein n=1 Tax=Solirubrobacter ginsenosidimutans TaxID=490573 RepID=UPI0022CDEEA7|nr:hypothetical protein [Solirubrobacter ginsenosidimutans]
MEIKYPLAMCVPYARRPTLVAEDGRWGPWTVAGGPDPAFDDVTRNLHCALLTDAQLLTCFRRRFPEHSDVDYDEMVRLLGYVWDCRDDGFANVVGYRCGHCRRDRASAMREHGNLR